MSNQELTQEEHLSEHLAEQIQHNKDLIQKFQTQEDIEYFESLSPSEHHQYVLNAINQKKIINSNTCKERYIGKIALLHLYQLQNESQI